jgi:hypothetical protein
LVSPIFGVSVHSRWLLAVGFWLIAAGSCIAAETLSLAIIMHHSKTTEDEDENEYDKSIYNLRRRRPRTRTRELKSPEISTAQPVTCNLGLFKR